ncbi:diacylglycerol O-acyltransferase [Mycolicibacterium cyprinidarum]|uniref:Diacylglycerol O-acyltransferase n=1 Tax=Mycolicibacterium cyprinidarum TaxID=2860311 RepID=A0ABQ4V7N0_9MYCO|nr:diacylglycerol O-acyltransferase [Mycolicibacterium sp. NGTWSNA01]GJF16732.1 diacylglycerol O-acyltransferase [Mycolicibacterium sp. NGTWS0302]
MMNRLTGLDGVSLHGETAVMPTHVLAVMFLDPAARGELTARAVLRLLAARASAIPSFRQRLLTKPFGLGQPAWIEDPAFNVHDHLHQVRLTEPGTMRELNSLIGELHAQPLDRQRPLWDSWVVQGLADGRLVVVIKFSHAISDGVGAVTSLLPELMTADPDAEFAATPRQARAPLPGLAARAWDVIDEAAANTAASLRIATRLAPVAVKSVAQTTLVSVRQLLSGAQRVEALNSEQDQSSQRSPLNAPLTARRSVAFAEVAMDDVRAITGAFGVTVNDVFLTATTSSLRRWLETHDTVPNSPLRTMMPISTRGADDEACNSWSPVVVTLPVHVADPAEQLAAIHRATSRIKKGRGSTPPVNLADVIDLVPPLLIGLASGLYSSLRLSRFHSPVAHMITSNVPGPPTAMYCAGAHVLGIHAIAPLVEGANLNVTAVSYDRTFAVGIVACPDNVDDVAAVARGIEDVVKELRIVADEKTGRSADMVHASGLEQSMSFATTTEFTHFNERRSAQAETSGTKQPA